MSVHPKYFSQARIPRCAVLDGSPPLQFLRSFRLPLKQLCSSSMALMVNAPPSSFFRLPPDPPPYEYTLLEALSPVAPPEPPDAVYLLALLRILVTSSPCQLMEGSILRSCPDLPSHPPVTVPPVVNVPMDRVSFGSTFAASERFLPALEEKIIDICYLLNMILTCIVLPVVSCLELCLFPLFPFVWSELEDKPLLVLKGSSSQLMLSYAVDAVSVILWVTLGTIIQEAYEIVVM
ncbi:hypothetical protein YC2023_078676 [Brassica napus]